MIPSVRCVQVALATPCLCSWNFLVLDFFFSPVGNVEQSHHIRSDVRTPPLPALSCSQAWVPALLREASHSTFWDCPVGWAVRLPAGQTLAVGGSPAIASVWDVRKFFYFCVFCMLFVCFRFLQSAKCQCTEQELPCVVGRPQAWSHFFKVGAESWRDSAFT